MASAVNSGRLPTLFIPHGGGPCFFMEEGIGPKGTWDRMAAYLRGLSQAVGQRPQAILVISGHWEEARPTVNAGRHPPLLFDYYGFPEHTYRLAYPAPGSPELAQRVRAVLTQAGIASGEDSERGFDHGIFIPFLLIYPQADIPIVQLSLRQDLDPAAHLAIGRALAPLRDEGVLIAGSGMSFHNLRYFGSMDPRVLDAAQRFDDWLAATVEEPNETRRASRWKPGRNRPMPCSAIPVPSISRPCSWSPALPGRTGDGALTVIASSGRPFRVSSSVKRRKPQSCETPRPRLAGCRWN